MTKTAKQIQGDVYRLLQGSPLSSMISGKVYRGGYRPRDSGLEDAVVIFTTGTPDQVQTGVVTVNIYVPDIDPFDNGVMVEDGARTAELEAAAQQWAEGLTAAGSDYRFALRQTIYTEEEPETREHFIVIKLGYSLFEESGSEQNTEQTT